MKRILVPTDFSPTAEKAFRFALEIASRSKGTIILYHAHTPVEENIELAEKIKLHDNNQLDSNVVKRLHRLIKKVSGDSKSVVVSAILGRTPIINNILGFVKHNHIDLIVMGTQGASGLKKVIIGSLASHVIKKSEVPVFLIPEKYNWKLPENIALASNLELTDMQGLPFVIAFSKLFHKGVHIVHFYSNYVSKQIEDDIKLVFNNYVNSIKLAFNNCMLNFELLKASSIDDTMETLDTKLSHDILVMIRSEKRLLENLFIKSFTKKMAYISKKPLLIIPEKFIANLEIEMDVVEKKVPEWD